MRIRKYKLILVWLVFAVILSGCVNVVVKDEGEAEAVVAPDLGATAEAMLGQADAPAAEVPAATEAPASPPPAPTATRYIPEGELAYFNFENLAEGYSSERAPGVILRNPGTFGIEVVLDRDADYFLATDVKDHPDGNISTYVLNVTPPAETTAFVACRVEQQASDDPDLPQSAKQAYIAKFRLDGAAQLIKKQNGQDFVLADWVSGIGINSNGIYNQLYLLCDGSRLLFMVNAQVVFDIQDNSLTEGDFAIGVAKNPSGAETVVRFDKVAVFEP